MIYGCICMSLLAKAVSPAYEGATTNPSQSDIPQVSTASAPASASMADWQMAHHYFQRAQFIQSLARIEKHLMEHPGDCNAQYLKVHILIQLGECENAKLTARALLEIKQLLFVEWIPYLHQVVEQAQPDGVWEEAAHYPPSILPWEA